MQAIFHAESRILELIWRACPPDHSLRATTQHLARFAPFYQPAGWLVNGFHMSILTPADQQWLTTSLLPHLFGQRVEAPVAIVQPRSIACQLAFNTALVRGHYPVGRRPRQFSSRAAAWRWLTAPPHALALAA